MQRQTLIHTHPRRLGHQALIEIYEQQSPRLFRYAFRLLGNSDLAEECVAETFSRFLKAVQNGGARPDNVQAYLYRMAHNWIIDHYRSDETEELDAERHVDTHGNPAAVLTRQMEQERVRRALMQLSAVQRQVILLRFLEDWSHEQVSAAIGKSIEATRAIQHRALSALRALLVEQEG